uniref:Endosome/lysosome-associated apoptosis and autophagy regulator 1 n=1 Tax=Cercocebus atys TaxID=9531 RepID=A0A2K5LHW0_CERAT
MAEPGHRLSARGRGTTERRTPRLLRLLLWAGTAFQVTQGTGPELHACKESEYHYEYTACDSTGSRWRVAVPHTPGLCTSLPDPVKGTECSFSCNAGEFLDMKDQSCKPCAEGRYSLGTGIRFDEWDELPHGFASLSANMELDDGAAESTGNCTSSKWVPQGDYIASNTDECTATLMYAVNLKQSGTVNFEYYYPDSSIIFEFFVQNDQCQPNADDSRWMKTTEKGWEFHSVELNRGNNVLYWRTTAFSVWSRVSKPVLVRNIAITGVAYTSECFPCKPGTYASKKGSSFCKLCPANSYSNKGETSCHQCDPDKYSEKGSSSCNVRPACTDKDYFYTHTACDANGETQLMYKWAKPKICSEDLEGAVKLLASGVKTSCPPCNPGFFKTSNSTCQPCPYGSYSNGSDCTHCPAGTEPAVGFEYKWWNTLPTNMETTVLSGINFEYKGMTGWEVAGDHIYTVAGASDNDFMILTLVVPGFRPPQSVMADTENKEVARITFVFETLCSVNCELYFMVGVNSRTNTPVETWKGSKGKQSYTYIIEENTTTSFTWAFQRTTFHEAGRKMSVCTDNVTDLRIPEGESGFSKSITAYVCQAVIIPPEVTGYKAGVSSQPVSLADRLIGVTTDMTLDGITSPAELFHPESLGIPDVIFFYRSNDVTQSCSSGRSTTIRVRCSPQKTVPGSLSLPGTCSDGTCDGCNFHFLWESAAACPLCSVADYHAIVSSCVAGIQKTTYVWREPKLCSGGISLPEQRVTICKTIDFWLKVGISAGTCTAILLTVLTCYFWKKNQKLEYKYSKLVMNATLKDCDLPAADSCAIMEGEDVEDDLIFTSKKSLFGKIKSFTSKRTPDGFDSVPLKTSSGGPDMDL